MKRKGSTVDPVPEQPSLQEIRDEYLRAARFLVSKGRWDAARDSLLHMIERFGEDCEVLMDLGNVYTSLGDYAAAATAYHRVEELGGPPEAILAYARSLFRAGEVDDALVYLKAKLSTVVDASLRLAILDELTFHCPGDTTFIRQKAEVLEETGAYPLSAMAYLDLCEKLMLQGRADEAREACRKAMELDPSNRDGLQLMRVLEDRVKPVSHALLDEARRVRDEGDLEGAVQAYASAIRAGLDAAEVHYEIALVLMQLKRWLEAATHLQKVTQEQSLFIPVQFSLGQCYEQLGDLPSAAHRYLSAFEAVDPNGLSNADLPEYWEMTSAAVRALKVTGRYREAVAVIRQFQAVARSYPTGIVFVERAAALADEIYGPFSGHPGPSAMSWAGPGPAVYFPDGGTATDTRIPERATGSGGTPGTTSARDIGEGPPPGTRLASLMKGHVNPVGYPLDPPPETHGVHGATLREGSREVPPGAEAAFDSAETEAAELARSGTNYSPEDSHAAYNWEPTASDAAGQGAPDGSSTDVPDKHAATPGPPADGGHTHLQETERLQPTAPSMEISPNNLMLLQEAEAGDIGDAAPVKSQGATQPSGAGEMFGLEGEEEDPNPGVSKEAKGSSAEATTSGMAPLQIQAGLPESPSSLESSPYGQVVDTSVAGWPDFATYAVEEQQTRPSAAEAHAHVEAAGNEDISSHMSGDLVTETYPEQLTAAPIVAHDALIQGSEVPEATVPEPPQEPQREVQPTGQVSFLSSSLEEPSVSPGTAPTLGEEVGHLTQVPDGRIRRDAYWEMAQKLDNRDVEGHTPDALKDQDVDGILSRPRPDGSLPKGISAPAPHSGDGLDASISEGRGTIEDMGMMPKGDVDPAGSTANTKVVIDSISGSVGRSDLAPPAFSKSLDRYGGWERPWAVIESAHDMDASQAVERLVRSCVGWGYLGYRRNFLTAWNLLEALWRAGGDPDPLVQVLARLACMPDPPPLQGIDFVGPVVAAASQQGLYEDLAVAIIGLAAMGVDVTQLLELTSTDSALYEWMQAGVGLARSAPEGVVANALSSASAADLVLVAAALASGVYPGEPTQSAIGSAVLLLWAAKRHRAMGWLGLLLRRLGDKAMARQAFAMANELAQGKVKLWESLAKMGEEEPLPADLLESHKSELPDWLLRPDEESGKIVASQAEQLAALLSGAARASPRLAPILAPIRRAVETGDWPLAVSQLSQVVQRMPKVAVFRKMMALAMIRARMYDDAIRVLVELAESLKADRPDEAKKELLLAAALAGSLGQRARQMLLLEGVNKMTN